MLFLVCLCSGMHVNCFCNYKIIIVSIIKKNNNNNNNHNYKNDYNDNNATIAQKEIRKKCNQNDVFGCFIISFRRNKTSCLSCIIRVCVVTHYETLFVQLECNLGGTYVT